MADLRSIIEAAPTTKRPIRLSSLMGALVLILALLCSMVCGALVVLTTVLHRSTDGATIAVESVRLAEEAQIDLLLHERAIGPLVKRELASTLRRRLARLQQFVTSAHEGKVLADATENVDAYLATVSERDVAPDVVVASHAAAYDALDALADVNVADARQAQQSAQAWDRLANVIGIGVGALLIAVVAITLIWLKLRAFAPIGQLAAVMARFASGESDARAPVQGPAELRDISRRFNEMAAALAAQRKRQVAFLAGVAHDLRNPLGVVKMGVAFVRPNAPLPPEPKLRRVLQTIDRQVTRLDRMVGDFLDTARMEAGELELRIAPADMRRIVQEVCSFFDPESSGPIEVSMPDEPIVVECDQLRIEQVITNLISNAIKYSPPGASVDVAVEPCEGHVAVRVTDRGRGIATEDLDRIFEPFRRVGLSRECVPGVGLGLFVVRRIIEAHRGRIELDSEPGAGSTFRIVLPRSPSSHVALTG